MGAKVRGIRQAKANLDRIIKDVQGRKVVRALQSALLIGSAQAAIYTAIDTSTLINSQFREIIVNGVLITGRAGYTANYAVFVHDPEVKQTFRRASARKEFLTKGFEDRRANHERFRLFHEYRYL
ncbi:HK97 gp10 family phage protein [Raoultella planticola]